MIINTQGPHQYLLTKEHAGSATTWKLKMNHTSCSYVNCMMNYWNAHHY